MPKITNKQLQEQLKNYPDDADVVVSLILPSGLPVASVASEVGFVPENRQVVIRHTGK